MALPTAAARLAGRPVARLLVSTAARPTTAPGVAQRVPGFQTPHKTYQHTGVRAFSTTPRRQKSAALKAAPGILKIDDDEFEVLLEDSEDEEGVDPDLVENPEGDRGEWDMPMTERFNWMHRFKDAGEPAGHVEKPRSSSDYQMAVHYYLKASQLDRSRDAAPGYVRRLLRDHAPDRSLDADWLYPSNAAQRVRVMEWVVEMMKKDGYLPTVGTMHMLLQGYAAAGQGDKMQAARQAIKQQEPGDMLADGTCLVHALKEGKSTEAWAIFQEMRNTGLQPPEEAYQLLMQQGAVFSKMMPGAAGGNPHTTYATYLLKAMGTAPAVVPSSTDIFTTAIELCQKEPESIDFSVGVVRELQQCKALPKESLSVYSALLAACRHQAKHDAVAEVWDLAQSKDMLRRDVESAAARAQFYVQCMGCLRSTAGKRELAEKVYHNAVSQWDVAKTLPADFWENYFQTLNSDRVPVDVHVARNIAAFQQHCASPPAAVYEALLDMAARGGAGTEALRLLQDMQRSSLAPSLKCYQDTLEACVKMMTTRSNRPTDAGVRGVVVETALHVFNTMPHAPDYGTLKAAILLLARAGQWDRAMQLLQDMKPVYGVEPQHSLIRDISALLATMASVDKHVKVVSKVIDDYQIVVDSLIVRNLMAVMTDDNLRIKFGQISKNINNQPSQ